MINCIQPMRDTKSDFTLSCLTINVWGKIDSFLHPNMPDEKQRMDAILDTIETHLPDLLCLQEVTSSIFVVLHTRLVQLGYATPNTDPIIEFSTLTYFHTCQFDYKHYKQCFLSNDSETKTAAIQRSQHFGIVILEHKNTKRHLSFATFHLPSGVQYSKERLLFFMHYLQEIQMLCLPWILAGDTNFTFHQEEELRKHVTKNVCDAWEEIGKPMDKRSTYDPQKNTNLQNKRRSIHPGSRFDRIFFERGTMQISDFQLVCTNAICDANKHPSDHFGIIATFYF